MGQKVNPFLLRIGFIKNWHSRWYAKSKDFPRCIEEDYRIRKFIKTKFKQAAISKIVIERLADKLRVRIFSARRGILIGRHGQDIERLKSELSGLVNREVSIDIVEVKNPNIEAQLIAENITFQLEKRIAFRRAVKRAMEQCMDSGAKGVKVSCSGRLNGAEMSRTETYKQGKVPLQTLRADIDYGFAEALTTYGLIGVKVWVYKGEILRVEDVEKEVPEPQETRKTAPAASA